MRTLWILFLILVRTVLDIPKRMFRWAIGRIVRWLYFRYFFQADDVIAHFVITFLPDEPMGLNRQFLLQLTRNRAFVKGWDAQIFIDNGGYRVRYVRSSDTK